MSIETMISLHPDVASSGVASPSVASNVNTVLAKAAQHLSTCAAICTSCADACVAERMDMRQCIRACLDCADVCTATARLAVRRSGQNVDVLRAALAFCAQVCDSCAHECDGHEAAHCRLCAQMCRECAEACLAAAPTVE